SLQMLVLRNNNIHRIQPASFFLNMRRFHVLDLSHNKVKSICEEDLLSFQGKHFTLLTLASVTLQDMNEYWLGWDKCGNPFKNMSVMVLDLSGNGFKVPMTKRFFDIQTNSHSRVLRLVVLRFSICPNHIFLLCPIQYLVFFFFFLDLEQITLAQNEINIIENDAFLGMTNLQKLNLSNNFLGSIDSSGEKLEEMLWNQFMNLTEFHLCLFYPTFLKNLTTLDLEFNRLKDLSDLYTILREFSQIEKTFLRGNMFSMCHNQRQIVVSDKLQLLNLELSTMQLIWSEGKCLDVFNNLHQLEQLSLASNGLQSLPKDIFKDLTSLIFLDLSFNSLKHLPNGIFPESLQILKSGLFSTLSYLSLMKNQFHCDCSLRDFQTWLNQTSVTLFHSIEDVTFYFVSSKMCSSMNFSVNWC
uniref:Toll-like receptor 5b n=1 Tax=Sinocyclocheilus rhinocerous TaxID=307959 RepID=A0A673IV86_9TELE